jgi:hypothetical protein
MPDNQRNSSTIRNLRQLRADAGPLGPYGAGHFNYDESEALLTVVEDVAANWDNIHTHYGATTTCRACDAMARLIPQCYAEEEK